VAAPLAAAASALVLLDAIVAVLVVYAAGFFIDEDFVGFGYCYEFVVGALITSGGLLVKAHTVAVLCEKTYGFLSGW
jgi:biotin transporter BioY